MLRQHQVEVAKEFGWEMQATRFQDRDFSLTQMVIPRKHKTIRQLRELHERRRSAEQTEERELLKVKQLLDTVQTERADWSVSGGNLVFATAPANDAQIVIMREVPLTQETNYRENEVLPAETLERNFDKLMMLVQQLKAHQIQRKMRRLHLLTPKPV